MFYNLLMEMSKHRPRITEMDIAQCLNVSENTAKSYLNGTSKISWSDVLKIKHTYFPAFDIEYLFHTDEKKSSVL